ncbi:hypothetical protein [Paracoccus sp. IB05]|uniref:hypothetical protein n=1 Tax=Paracoccus sp. IB05 TaxID=2779367 RepID=UPI0018E8763B|nr:hypothetical protein [Paracoccus sp. IB05]MBJ2150595.1 hypothetical protein [Paracoccus sp. IB05]
MKVPEAHDRVAWVRILVGVLLLLTSGLGAYVFQPLISGKTDAINIVVTVFSILAGFLIAVITFIGDPGRASWKQLQMRRPEVRRRLMRHELLFYLYLLTLAVAMSLYLIPKELEQVLLWAERLFLFFAIMVFLVSFGLPSSLRALQLARYDEAREADLPAVLKRPEQLQERGPS